jgi:sialate O-acetylesterase
VIWYQGETNTVDKQYALKQQILIEGWRKLWGEGDFPFYIVQVAPFEGYPTLPDFWLEQYEAVRKTPNTGLISIVDIGDIKECHPKNKSDVGKRLALLALRDTYGRKGLVASGPTCKSVKINGGEIVIALDHLGTGLATKDGQAPNWLEVAAADKKFVKAEVAIRDDTLVIKASPVENPVYVRYAWNYVAVPNLCNKEGLPAFPFNTAEPFFQQR